MTERVAIVYGSRKGRIGQYYAATWLSALLEHHGITTVRHGDCVGIDQDAGRIAARAGLSVDPMPADWRPMRRNGLLDRSAGPKRNQAMVDKDPAPVLGVEFPGGTGTADMRRRLERAGVTIERWDGAIVEPQP